MFVFGALLLLGVGVFFVLVTDGPGERNLDLLDRGEVWGDTCAARGACSLRPLQHGHSGRGCATHPVPGDTPGVMQNAHLAA